MKLRVIKTELLSPGENKKHEAWTFDPTGLDDIDHYILHQCLPFRSSFELGGYTKRAFVEVVKRIGHEAVIDEGLSPKEEFYAFDSKVQHCRLGWMDFRYGRPDI